MPGDWLTAARTLSPPCNVRARGYQRTPRDTRGCILTVAERAILYGLIAAAVGLITVVFWGICA